MEDMNTREYLERVKNMVLENLRRIGGPPSVPLTEIPKLPHDDIDDGEALDSLNIDERRSRT